MRLSADNLILCLITALTAAASIVVAVQSFGVDRRGAVGREFQSVLGGLGLGCQIDLSRCSWQFDPRVAGDEDTGLDSIACLSELSPWHSVSLFPAPSHGAALQGE